MNYEQAMSFLEETKQYGSRLGLECIRLLMRGMGDIQEHIPVVHIGGTNGKGTVGAILSAVFTQRGYRVGWFNTPDVFSYEEEFRINGKEIEKDRLAGLYGRIKENCDQMTGCGFPHPTRFEVETAAAFLWFFEENCDLALIEVGMGGASDATNLIKKPLVSVLTSIDMDHTEFLGESLNDIAKVKTGIIKPGCPVVSARQMPEVMSLIRQKCGEISSPLHLSDAAINAPFREVNAACAAKVAEVLSQYYPDRFPDPYGDVIWETARTLCWPGRYEQIGSHPDIYLDGAHNAGAARMLADTLDADFSGRRILYIMGVLVDKDCRKMAQIMFERGDRVYTVTPPGPRGMPAGKLCDVLRQQDIDAVPCENMRDAVSYVLREAGPDDVILSFGSLSFLGEIREAFYEAPEWVDGAEKEELK